MNVMNAPTVCSIVAALFALSACESTPTTGPGEEAFGNAVRHNMTVQVVNPEPKPDAAAAPVDGSKIAIAIGRYKSDKVKPPREIRTSDVGSDGGGGD